MHTDPSITTEELQARFGAFPPPTLIDVRRVAAFERDPRVIPGALRRVPEDIDQWSRDPDAWRSVVVYCVHGHEVSRNAAAALRGAGFAACILEGGFERWCTEGRNTTPFVAPTHWVTRARPKIDRIACPWLIRRFIDPSAEFHYVSNAEVRAFAAETGATPYRHPRRRLLARRRSMQFRRLHPAARADRRGTGRPRDHRARRRHRRTRSRAAGAGPARHVARVLGADRRRPGDAAPRSIGLRRALRLVP